MLLLFTACAKQEKTVAETAPTKQPQASARPPPVAVAPAKRRQIQRLPASPARGAPPQTIGSSVGNRPIRLHRLGSGPQSVLILGGIHGNEPASARLVELAVRELADRPELLAGRTIWIIPAANPDGLAVGTRLNKRRVDLNRNFPAENRRELARYGAGPLSEPESRALYDLIARTEPRRILSVHQPAACVDYDGPAAALARRVSEACGLPVERLGGKPGSLGSYAGNTLGISIITLELPGAATRLSDTALWSRFGPAIEAFTDAK